MNVGYIDAVYDVAQSAIDWKEKGVPSLPDKSPFLLRFKRLSVEVVSPPASPAPASVHHPRPSSADEGHGPKSKKPRLAENQKDEGRKDDVDSGEEGQEGEDWAQSDDEREEAALVGPRVGDLEDVHPYPVDVDFGSIPRMAVLRPSPLVCVNQDIVSHPSSPSLLLRNSRTVRDSQGRNKM